MRLCYLLGLATAVRAAVTHPSVSGAKSNVFRNAPHLTTPETPPKSLSLHQVVRRDETHEAYKFADAYGGPLVSEGWLHFLLCWEPRNDKDPSYPGTGCRHMGIVVGYVDPSKKTYDAVFLHALLKGSTWLNVQRRFTGLKEGQNLQRPGYIQHVDTSKLLGVGQVFVDWMNKLDPVGVTEEANCFRYYEYVLQHMRS
ncbi:hypothetical protein CGRA01v4_06129 [Colletotrichum graminicola]|nr:hypothetical protein CGRA01v4_06129 [Colletotrichum graminicola]